VLNYARVGHPSAGAAALGDAGTLQRFFCWLSQANCCCSGHWQLGHSRRQRVGLGNTRIDTDASDMGYPQMSTHRRRIFRHVLTIQSARESIRPSVLVTVDDETASGSSNVDVRACRRVSFCDARPAGRRPIAIWIAECRLRDGVQTMQ